MKKILNTALLLASCAFIQHANAATCTNSPASPLLTTSDVTFRNGEADACYFRENGGANDETTIANYISGLGVYGTGWTTLGRDTDQGTTGASSIDEFGVRWTLNSQTDSGQADNEGTWTLSWQDLAASPNLPAYFDFAAVTKAANDWTAYFFQAEYLANNGSGGGNWVIKWANGNAPVGADISSLSVYGRFLRECDPDADVDCRPTTPTGDPLPEPSLVALLGIGLLGMTYSRRRTR